MVRRRRRIDFKVGTKGMVFPGSWSCKVSLCAPNAPSISDLLSKHVPPAYTGKDRAMQSTLSVKTTGMIDKALHRVPQAPSLSALLLRQMSRVHQGSPS